MPTGTRYFRVVASAPGYADSSVAVGPETVLDGIGPFGQFLYEVSSPYQTGVPWYFNIIEPSVISNLALRVQWSAAPTNAASWSDLPGGQMTRFGSTWALNATNLPLGDTTFRVVASAPTYFDRISGNSPPFIIEPRLPTKAYSYSSSATYQLDAIDPRIQKRCSCKRSKKPH